MLKALALGARMVPSRLIKSSIEFVIHSPFHFKVFLGRPILWGLAHSGQAGVTGVIQLLKKELDLAMALSGKKKQIL